MSYTELTEGADPIVKPNTLSSWLKRKKARYARRGYGEGVTALIVLESLPKATQEMAKARIGDPDVLRADAKKAALELPADEEARVFFGYRYKYDKNGVETSLPERLADEYTLNARVLNLLILRQNLITATANKLGTRPLKMGEALLSFSEELRRQHGHTLPQSERNLLKKLKAYREEGYASLVSQKVGNSNSQKLTSEAGDILISLMRSKSPVHTPDTAWEEYNRRAPLEGLPLIKSVQTVRDYLHDPAVAQLWMDAQRGEKAVHRQFGIQLRLEKPRTANALWAADGTRLSLYFLGRDGKRTTTDIYFIFDVATGYVVGWKLGGESSEEVQKPAFRMALQNAGVRPYEIVMDNQSGQKKLDRAGFFRKVAVHGVRFKTPYRAQANPAERLIGLFQTSVLRKYPYYTGQNITSKKESSRPNEEWVLANERLLPTYEEIPAIVAEAVAEWHRMIPKGETMTREELYRSERVSEELKPYTREEWREIFFEKKDRPVTYLNAGLELEVNGTKLSYTAYTADGRIDAEWHSKNVRRQFGVKLDPADPTEIAIYRIDRDGEWRYERMLTPTKRVAMAAFDRTERDDALTYSALRADKELRIERSATAQAIDLKSGANAGWNTPRVQGLTQAENDEALTRAYEKIEADGLDPVEIVRVLSGRQDKIERSNRPKISLAGLMKEKSNQDWLDIARDKL